MADATDPSSSIRFYQDEDGCKRVTIHCPGQLTRTDVMRRGVYSPVAASARPPTVASSGPITTVTHCSARPEKT